MLESIVGVVTFLQFISIDDILIQWEQIGVFDFILPFLFAFIVIYGILEWTGIFNASKGVNIIISLVLGLLAIRAPFYAEFLKDLSPRLGVGIAILLAIIILIGLFTPKGSKDVLGWILLAVGVVIFIVIGAQLYNRFYGGGVGGFFSSDLIGYIILIALLIGIIVAVSVSGGDKNGKSGGSAAEKILEGLFKS
ncbi:hypothetical protein D6817_01830 [Candidatus Pacearchaeota archaeon]|nr:MAG: hypothetical protein D6817_01830 [Candidatus Pacearchaeota archaeon]